MRFSATILSGMLAVLASAADSTSAAPPTSVSVDAATASLQACLAHCDENDVNCRAHCATVPSPNQSQVMQTTACATKCNQGDGSKEATDAYAQCLEACVTNNFYTTSFGTPESTPAPGADTGKGDSGSDSSSGSGSSAGSGSSGSGSNAGASGKGDSGSGSGASKTSAKATGTKTSSATSSPTGNSAPLVAGSAMLGLLGAVLAL